MRRFELTDDTSNKFWQIAIDGDTTLRINFGKIGQKGQIQLKKLASAATAAAEMEKLIREKTKKGYVAIAHLETPAPAVQSSSSPARSADRFVWTTAAEKLAAAARRPAPTLAAAEDRDRIIVTAIVEAKEDFALAHSKWTAETTPIRERIVDAFAKQPVPATVDLELEAAAATVARYGDPLPAFVARWLALGGVRTALEVLARMWGYTQSYESSPSNKRPTWLVLVDPAKNWDSSVATAKREATDILAAEIARRPEAERAEARAIAAELRARVPLPVRVGLARALDDARFAAEDAAEVIALPKGAYPHDAKMLMRLVDDAATLEGLVGYFGFDYHAFRSEVVVRRIGVPAAKVIGQRLAKAGSRPYEIEIATYLATLECAETARVLVGWLPTKGVDVVAKELFTRRPDLAFPALGSALAGRGKLALFAEPVAKSLLTGHMSTFEAIANELDPKALAALRELCPSPPSTGDDAGVDEAAPADLPRILASPPWLETKKPTPPPIIEGVPPLPFTERITFDAAQRERWARPVLASATVREWYRLPTKLEPRTPAMDDAVREKMYTVNRYLASWLDLMSDGRVLRYFAEEDEVAVRDLSTDPSDLRYLLVRFGLDAVSFVFTAGRSDAMTAATTLLAVESPRAALFMAETATRVRKAKPLAATYFATYPEASAIALLRSRSRRRPRRWASPRFSNWQ
ncbi:MAG: Molybdate metabolism regulator [Labilithrix sp.]|nr:Molybdate metabolism regulator [Labilithrix sp.]